MTGKLFLFILFLMTLSSASAQYEKNPMEGKKWLNVSVGANTADNVSWQSAVSLSRRSDFMLTTGRFAFSQELIEGADDSARYKKNRIAEIGLLWGEAWGGKRWYIAASAGMGINIRMYADSSVNDNTTFQYLTAVTLGVPAQLEAGVMINKNIGINTTIIGNWNFRQPYLGLHLGFTYRFKNGSGS